MTKRSWNDCPEARSEGLLVEQVGDELVVFDETTFEAHALKPVAAAVFSAADGNSTVEDLAASVGATLGREVTMSEVDAALSELESVGLMVEPSETLSEGISRRRLLQVGGATAAGVMVSSALVPALAAASPTPCAPSGGAGSLQCGFSELAIVVEDQSGNYYAMKLDANNNLTCGPFTYCNGTSVSSYLGKAFTTPCPTGLSIIQGVRGIAVNVPSGYTLVAWYFHNGQPASSLTCSGGTVKGCLGPKTSGTGIGSTGCIELNPCAVAGCYS